MQLTHTKWRGQQSLGGGGLASCRCAVHVGEVTTPHPDGHGATGRIRRMQPVHMESMGTSTHQETMRPAPIPHQPHGPSWKKKPVARQRAEGLVGGLRCTHLQCLLATSGFRPVHSPLLSLTSITAGVRAQNRPGTLMPGGGAHESHTHCAPVAQRPMR